MMIGYGEKIGIRSHDLEIKRPLGSTNWNAVLWFSETPRSPLTQDPKSKGRIFTDIGGLNNVHDITCASRLVE